MAYVLNKTTGQVLITLQDGTADGPDINPGANASGMNLFGRNYPTYGQLLDENFVRLLQNFASAVPPSAAQEGQLWYDLSNASNQVLRIYTGSSWLPVTPVWVSPTAPTTTQVGAQWWDSTNYQLNLYNGSTWTTIGPGYKAPDGLSGAIVQDVTDTTNNSHTIIVFYTNNNPSVIVSYDAAFTLNSSNAITGFDVINPGITLSTEAGNLFYGTVVNSQQLGNIAAINYARRDIDSLFYGNVTLNGGNLEISANVGDNSVRFTNHDLYGNFDFYSNVSLINTKVLSINGTTGEVTVTSNPTDPLGLVTKQYADNIVSVAVAPLATIASPAFTGVPTAPNPIFSSNTSQVATMYSVQNAITNSNTAPWLGSQKTVSTSTPTPGTGNPGDFWFQI
jgi:hypothetical protein